MNDIEEKLIAKIQIGDFELPVLPAVGTQVIELTMSQDASAQDLAQLILNDQSLAGHILKVANSAAYAGVQKIQTLQQAVARLGMQLISQIAMSATVGKALSSNSPAISEITSQLWRHALASGLWAKEIARISRSNTEIAFVSGLLHQIGKPVALNMIAEAVQNNDSVDDELILDVMNAIQKELGIKMAESWNLPDFVIAAIKYVDDYESAGDFQKEVAIVNAAKQVAHLSLLNIDADEDEQLDISAVDVPIFSYLNLYEDDIETLNNKQSAINEQLLSMTL